MNNPGSTSFQTVRNVNKTDFKTVKHYKLSKYRLHYFDCNHFKAIKTAILFGYVTHVQSNTLVYSLTSTKEQALVKNVYTRVCGSGTIDNLGLSCLFLFSTTAQYSLM